VLRGSDVNLNDLPVPRWHHWDGGRYINTFAQVITKDPETGVQNVFMPRTMVRPGARRCPFFLYSSHVRRILKKIASGDVRDLGDTTTLADPTVVQSLVSERQ